MRLISIIVVFSALFGLVLALQGFHILNQSDSRLERAGFISSQIADYQAAKGCQ